MGLERAITLSHDKLLEAWPLLNAMAMDAQTGRHWLATLTDAAAEWDRSGRDPELLLVGTRLVHLRRFLSDWDVPTPPVVQAYLRASWAHGARQGPSAGTRMAPQRPSWLREGRTLVARYWQSLRRPWAMRLPSSGTESRSTPERGEP